MGQRIRIVSLVTNLYIAGDANRLLAFARSVDKTRFEHIVLLLVRPTDISISQVGPILERFQEYGIRTISLDETSLKALRQSQGIIGRIFTEIAMFIRIVRRLVQFFSEHRTDIIDARMSYAVLFAVVAGRLAKVPVIVGTEYGPEFWRPPFWYILGQVAWSMTDALISDSQSRIDTYQNWLLLRHPRAVSIPNGIYTPATKRTRDEMRYRFAIPDERRVRVIGQVSRLIPYKGHMVLLEAASRVIKEEPNIIFLICGYPHAEGYLDELQRRAVALGISNNVRIVSYPGPVGDVWAAIDIHAHASLYDSAPIAIHESMSLGLPAAVTEVGGIPDLVQDGVTGLVVPPGDPEALATALLRLLREPSTALRLGAAARARYEAKYKAETMSRALEQLFLSILRHSDRYHFENSKAMDTTN